MKKETKTVITHESIEKKLRDDNRTSLKHTAFVFFATLLACGTMSAIIIAFGFETHNLGIEIISAVFAAIASVPVWVMLSGFVKDLIEYKHLKNGDVITCSSIKCGYKKEQQPAPKSR